MHAFLAVFVAFLVAVATGAGVAETTYQTNMDGKGVNHEQLVDFSSTAIAGGPDPVHVAAHWGPPRPRAQAKGYPRPRQIGVPQQGEKSRTSTANASNKWVPKKYVRSH